MTIYILIYEENSDNRCGADVIHFKSWNEAFQAMQEKYHESLRNLGCDAAEQYLDSKSAGINTGEDSYHWRVEAREIDLPVPNVAIEVSGGMVQAVYADADLTVDVCDLDVSDLPDDADCAETDGNAERLDAFANRPGVKKVW